MLEKNKKTKLVSKGHDWERIQKKVTNLSLLCSVSRYTGTRFLCIHIKFSNKRRWNLSSDFPMSQSSAWDAIPIRQ